MPTDTITPRVSLINSTALGYGGPTMYYVKGVYDNRVLFTCESTEERTVAILGERERVKWEREWKPKEAFFDAIREKPLYSPLCSNCGEPGGNSSCLGRHWCSKPDCKAALQAAITDHESAERQRLFDYELRVAREREQRVHACDAAILGAFHWRDGWYFIRLATGAVRVVRRGTPQSEYLDADVTIPPDEWASIVCSVSEEGETSERWQAARRFHNTPDPATQAFSSDASSYKASLLVSPDFGCVMWEHKDAARLSAPPDSTPRTDP